MAKLDLKSLSIQELNAELVNTEKHYYGIKFNNAVSTLENNAEIKLVRRNIARINTELRARELATGDLPARDKIVARRRKSK